MTELMRLLVLLLVVGAAVTALASGVLWYGDERRRIVRALKSVLKAMPDALLIARGRGRGVGLSLANKAIAVTWDRGAWCLIYRLDELIGAELLVDGAVMARTFRGEARRALERVAGSAQDVSFRLIFDDPRHPDFELELWRAGDEERDVVATAAGSVQEANRWIASVEALLRRANRTAPDTTPASQPIAPPPLASSQTPEPDLFDDLPDDERDN